MNCPVCKIATIYPGCAHACANPPGESMEHEKDCDCGDCCVDCLWAPSRGYLQLNDNGRCTECAQEAHEHRMAAMMDQAKDARKYGP